MRLAFLQTLFAFLALPLIARAETLRQTIPKIARTITLDGSLADWTGHPFVPWGTSAPSERDAAATTWTGWNDAGLWIAAKTLESPALHNSKGVRRKLELFLDTRSPDTGHYDRFERGVYHFTVEQLGDKRKNCRIGIDHSYSGTESYSIDQCDAGAKSYNGGWEVEFFVPWSALGGFRPQTGGQLNAAIILTVRPATSAPIVLGTTDGLRAGQARQNPMNFWTFRLGPPAVAPQRTFYRVEEIVLQSEPWLEIEIVKPVEGSLPLRDGFSVRCPGLNLDLHGKLALSAGGHFQIFHDYVPLRAARPTASEMSIVLSQDGSSWKRTVSLPVPVTGARARIAARLPDESVASNPLRAFYRKSAQEIATLLCPAPDDRRLPQRAIRAASKPQPLQNRIDLFLERAAQAGRAEEEPLLFVFPSETDGELMPVRVIYPLDYDPIKTYPAQLQIYGLVRSRTPTQFVERELLLAAQGRNHAASGNGFSIGLYGRGNSHALFGDEDLKFVLTTLVPKLGIDRENISLFGESAGAQAAILLAARHPALFSYVHCKSGLFNPGALEQLLANLRYSPVFLEAGARDEPAVESGRLLLAMLKQANVPSVLSVLPNQGHTFFSSEPPAKIQESRNLDFPFRYRFATNDLAGSDAYFVRPQQLSRWNKSAAVEVDRSERGTLRIATTNVAALEIDLRNFSPPDYPLDVVVDARRVERITAPPPDLRRAYSRSDGWKPGDERPATAKRLGMSGPSGEIETKPYLVVYGTSDRVTAPALKHRAIAIIRSRIGSDAGQLGGGRIQLRADYEITDTDLATYNLWLLGGPGENLCAAKLAPSLPLGWDRGALLLDGTRFAGGDRLLSYITPCPANPNRYVYVECGTTPLAYRASVLPVRACDIVVQTLEESAFKLEYTGFFDSSWRAIEPRP
jgi:pimeloyl-ACP methyl ester carboxylesterase